MGVGGQSFRSLTHGSSHVTRPKGRSSARSPGGGFHEAGGEKHTHLLSVPYRDLTHVAAYLQRSLGHAVQVKVEGDLGGRQPGSTSRVEIHAQTRKA